MEPEKTVLQQIREKEQEYAVRLEEIRKETDAVVAASRKDAADLIAAAEREGKAAAAQVYTVEKERASADISRVKDQAVREREAFAGRGEKNLERAARKVREYTLTGS